MLCKWSTTINETSTEAEIIRKKKHIPTPFTIHLPNHHPNSYYLYWSSSYSDYLNVSMVVAATANIVCSFYLCIPSVESRADWNRFRFRTATLCPNSRYIGRSVSSGHDDDRIDPGHLKRLVKIYYLVEAVTLFGLMGVGAFQMEEVA